jgi:hypothetical protein
MRKDGIADQMRMKTENLVRLRKQLMGTSLCSKLSSTPVLSWVQISQQKHSQNMSCYCSIRHFRFEYAVLPDSRSSHVMTNDIDIMLTTFQGSPITAQARRTWSSSSAPLMTHGGNGLSPYYPYP